MRKFACTAIAILVVLPCVARCDDAKNEEPKIDGTWQATKAELAGKEMPKKFYEILKLTLKKGEYEAVAESPDRGTITYDTKADPKTMDIKGEEGPNKGKTFLAIYELKDDTLKICYELSGKSRPTEFKTKKDTKLFMVTYERKKESN